MVPWPRLTARYLTSIQRVVRDIVYIVCTMTVVTRTAAANGSRREEERLEDEGQRIQLEKGREKIERERGDIFRRIHTCVLARGTWFVHRLEGEKRSIGWRVGRVRFQGFPRLVFQRFLSTRANRSDPFVERERGGEGEGKWGVCRKLAFYERPYPVGTMEGRVKFAGKKSGEVKQRERKRESIIWIEESLILSAVLCKTRRKMPDANVRGFGTHPENADGPRWRKRWANSPLAVTKSVFHAVSTREIW